MSINTVTIDFWNTITIADSNGPERHAARIKAVQDLGTAYKITPDKDQIQKGRQFIIDQFENEWLGNHRTTPVDELVSGLLDYLSIPASREEIEHVTKVFQESLHDGPPDLTSGVESALKQLSEQASLVLISDTMFSPGRVLRDYLKQKGLYNYFLDFVFSDEVGVSKPRPETFRKALSATGAEPAEAVHVGDIHQTDIVGAKQIGMKAILYTGINDADKDHTTADYVCSTWEDVVKKIADL